MKSAATSVRWYGGRAAVTVVELPGWTEPIPIMPQAGWVLIFTPPKTSPAGTDELKVLFENLYQQRPEMIVFAGGEAEDWYHAHGWTMAIKEAVDGDPEAGDFMAEFEELVEVDEVVDDFMDLFAAMRNDTTSTPGILVLVHAQHTSMDAVVRSFERPSRGGED